MEKKSHLVLPKGALPEKSLQEDVLIPLLITCRAPHEAVQGSDPSMKRLCSISHPKPQKHIFVNLPPSAQQPGGALLQVSVQLPTLDNSECLFQFEVYPQERQQFHKNTTSPQVPLASHPVARETVEDVYTYFWFM